MLKQKLKDAKAILKDAKATLKNVKSGVVENNKAFIATPTMQHKKLAAGSMSEFVKATNAVTKAQAKVDTIAEKIEADTRG